MLPKNIQIYFEYPFWYVRNPVKFCWASHENQSKAIKTFIERFLNA